jgi:hypothetical protein
LVAIGFLFGEFCFFFSAFPPFDQESGGSDYCSTEYPILFAAWTHAHGRSSRLRRSEGFSLFFSPRVSAEMIYMEEMRMSPPHDFRRRLGWVAHLARVILLTGASPPFFYYFFSFPFIRLRPRLLSLHHLVPPPALLSNALLYFSLLFLSRFVRAFFPKRVPPSSPLPPPPPPYSPPRLPPPHPLPPPSRAWLLFDKRPNRLALGFCSTPPVSLLGVSTPILGFFLYVLHYSPASIL